MTMSDRVAILDDGELQQIAPPEVAYSQPANRFVAGFIGSPSMNFLDCELSAGTLRTSAFSLDAPAELSGSVETIGVRPEDMAIVSPQEGDFTAEVSVFEQVGSFNIVHLDIEGETGEVLAQVPGSKHVEHGQTVGVSIDADRVHLFDDAGDAVYNPPLHSEQQVTQV